MSLSAYRALASESRVRILHLLQERGAPLGVDEVAASVGLHVNTVREHLDHLVATEFVGRRSEVRSTRGRPRILYRALPRSAGASMDARAREHLLGLLLAGYGRTVDSPAELAEASGRQWADDLAAAAADAAGSTHGAAEPAVPRQGPTPPEWAQMAALEQHFEELGFEPEADLGADQVHLRRCPVRDLACARTEIVCSVHLGLARGVLANVDGPLEADRLEPFVDHDHCVLHLTRNGRSAVPVAAS